MIRLAAVCVFLCVSLSAQTSVVSPDHFRKAEGLDSNSLPLHRSDNRGRHLQVHDDLKGKPMTVKSVSLRLDRFQASVVPFSIILDGYCSSAATTSRTMNRTFDKNHGLDRKQVVKTKLFSFPKAIQSRDKTVFQYTIPFDKPFVFAGKSGLCWDLLVLGTTLKKSVRGVDATTTANANPPIYLRWFGTGCKASKGSLPFSLSVSQVAPSWLSGSFTLRFQSNGAQSNQPVILALGGNDKKFGAFSLPYLLPGTSTADTGPCYVYSDIVLAFVTLPKGTLLDFSLRLHLRKEFNGVRALWQAYSAGVPKSPWTFITSSAAEIQILAPYGNPPIGMVQVSNSTAAVGNAYNSRGLIVRFN